MAPRAPAAVALAVLAALALVAPSQGSEAVCREGDAGCRAADDLEEAALLQASAQQGRSSTAGLEDNDNTSVVEDSGASEATTTPQLGVEGHCFKQGAGCNLATACCDPFICSGTGLWPGVLTGNCCLAGIDPGCRVPR